MGISASRNHSLRLAPSRKPQIIPEWLMRMRIAAFATPLVLLLGSCVHLPPAAADLTREPLQRGMSTTCTSSRCTSSVSAGDRRYRVETRIDYLSLADALDGTRPSLGSRIAGGIADDLVRRTGFSTSHMQLSLARRTIRPRDGGLQMDCELVWVDDELREGREPTITRRRVAEGMTCVVMASGDTSDASWRFRRGISTAPDSLLGALSHLLDGPGTRVTSEALSMSLERVAPGADYFTSYEVAFEGYITQGGAVRGWRASVRMDAEVIARIHLVAERGKSAVDLSGSVTDEEAEVLRLVAACLLVPLDRD
jgi:hypothetical protein